jgi:hypothetical protein
LASTTTGSGGSTIMMQPSTSSSSLSSLQEEEAENENNGGGEDSSSFSNASSGGGGYSFLPVHSLKEFTSAVEVCKESGLKVMILFSEKRTIIGGHILTSPLEASNPVYKDGRT